MKRAKVRTTPFELLPDYVQEKLARAEAAYEEKCVKYLLSAFKMENRKWALLKQSEDGIGIGRLLSPSAWTTEKRRLTLAGFCGHFNAFPLFLQSRAESVSESEKLSSLLQKGREVFGELWLSQRAENFGDSRPFGLVLKWPYISHGLLLHTHTGLAKGDGTQLVWQRRGVRIFIEPLGPVISRLRKVWRPE